MIKIEKDLRTNTSCEESGNLQSAGQNLIVGGARLKDGLMIRAGINMFKLAGIPFRVIIGIARFLIQTDRQDRTSSND